MKVFAFLYPNKEYIRHFSDQYPFLDRKESMARMNEIIDLRYRQQG